MIFSTHRNKFWGNPKRQGIFIIICLLVALPVMFYSIYDSNHEEVWIKNDFEIKEGYTIGIVDLSDSTLYSSIINSSDTSVSMENFHLIPVSTFMKVIDITPDQQFFKVKWTVERNHKLPDAHYQCWISHLFVKKNM